MEKKVTRVSNAKPHGEANYAHEIFFVFQRNFQNRLEAEQKERGEGAGATKIALTRQETGQLRYIERH